MDLVNEIWKDIKGYENLYQVSNFGNVKSFYNKSHLLKLKPDKYGYISVTLVKEKKKKRKRVHRLVAEAFIENTNNYLVINHIDGNKQNNNVNNLEWCTQKHNIEEAWRLGLSKTSEKNRKISSEWCKKNKIKKVAQYDKEMKLIKIWNSEIEASKKTKISKTSINNNICGLSKSAGGYIWVLI